MVHRSATVINNLVILRQTSKVMAFHCTNKDLGAMSVALVNIHSNRGNLPAYAISLAGAKSKISSGHDCVSVLIFRFPDCQQPTVDNFKYSCSRKAALLISPNELLEVQW